MTVAELRLSLNQQEPPTGLSPLALALWYDAKGDWHRAHKLAQDIGTADGSWVHGYLHLREGDRSNAAYWYQQARQPLPATPLEHEWDRIASHLVG